MKRTVRENINAAFSLHDMNVTAFDVSGDDIIMKRYRQFGFSIMDETYGYNMTKYTGYLLSNRQHCECIIEIYHEGDMVFVSEE